MSTTARPIITLTTDFGTHDSYVSIMKGVILGMCPEARLVDVTHAIAPQNLQEAVFVLQTFTAYFPPRTVHLVVVDPGVGSKRLPLALQTPAASYVGPDNGVFTSVWHEALQRWSPDDVRAVVLDKPLFWRPGLSQCGIVSATFHGCDIFAPVAAHLAADTTLDEVGSLLDTPVLLPIEQPAWEENGGIIGEIIYIDHFGNCVTNITTDHLRQMVGLPLNIELPGSFDHLVLSLVEPDHAVTTRSPFSLLLGYTYADVAPGQIVALVGSTQRLEIAQRNGSASDSLAIEVGMRVRVACN